MRWSSRLVLGVALGALQADCLNTLDRCGRGTAGASFECPIRDVFGRAFSVRVDPAEGQCLTALANAAG